MSDFAAALRARLDCVETWEQWPPVRSALELAVGLHRQGPHDCYTCEQPWPCTEIRVIAKALGIEARRV